MFCEKHQVPRHRTKAGGYRCKQCDAETQKAYKQTDSYKVGRERSKAKRYEQSRRWVYQNLYGITYEQRHEMYLSQYGKCAICAVDCEEFGMDTDHDHTTGRVRGLLCRKCNKAIGLLNDSPEVLRAAAAYLEA